MNRIRSRRAVTAIAFALILAGCATVPLNPQPPEVSLAGVDAVRFGLAQQRFRIALSLYNPNDYRISVKSMNYQVTINDIELGRGGIQDPVTLPARGETVVHVEMVGRLLSFLGELGRAMDDETDHLTYRIKGDLALSRPPITIPFDRKGDISMPSGEDLPE